MFPLEQIIRFTGFEAACIKPGIAHILDCGHGAGRVGLAGVITPTEETQLCQTWLPEVKPEPRLRHVEKIEGSRSKIRFESVCEGSEVGAEIVG
jgi:hypothetical protein